MLHRACCLFQLFPCFSLLSLLLSSLDSVNNGQEKNQYTFSYHQIEGITAPEKNGWFLSHFSIAFPGKVHLTAVHPFRSIEVANALQKVLVEWLPMEELLRYLAAYGAPPMASVKVPAMVTLISQDWLESLIVRDTLWQTNSLLLNMAIYSWFTHQKWWFSIVFCTFPRG